MWMDMQIKATPHNIGVTRDDSNYLDSIGIDIVSTTVCLLYLISAMPLDCRNRGNTDSFEVSATEF
jgi:hypothetical protein